MSRITAWLLGLLPVLTPLAINILVGLGFAAVTYAGIGAFWDSVKGNIASYFGDLPGSVMTILFMARIDDAITLVLSAGTAKLALKGLTAAGALKRIYWTGGSPMVLN